MDRSTAANQSPVLQQLNNKVPALPGDLLHKNPALSAHRRFPLANSR